MDRRSWEGCAYILIHQTRLAYTAISKDDDLSKEVRSASQQPSAAPAPAAGLAYLEKDLLVARRHLDWLSVATLAAPMT